VRAQRSRSDAAEKLLADVRQSLVVRTEEVRATEARLLEATVARGNAEKKVEHLSTVCDGWDQQAKKLEQTSADLSNRCKVLSETLAANESSLVHAREKIKSLTGHVEQLQLDAAASRAQAEEDIVQLNATIEHERCERTLAEGALEAARSDYARIQNQVAQERSMRRGEHQRRLASHNLSTSS
jgi:crescentin